jgi:hypothetical protein
MVSSWWCQDIMIFIQPWPHPDITMARFPTDGQLVMNSVSRIMPFRWGILKVSTCLRPSLRVLTWEACTLKVLLTVKINEFIILFFPVIPGIKSKTSLKKYMHGILKNRMPMLIHVSFFWNALRVFKVCKCTSKDTKKLVTCSYDLQTLLSTRP